VPVTSSSSLLATRSLTLTGKRKILHGNLQAGGSAEEYTQSPILGVHNLTGGLVIMQCGYEFGRTASSERENDVSQPGNRSLELAPSKKFFNICHISDSESQTIVLQFEESTLRNYVLGSPAVDDLLTLVPFNMYRALLDNAHIIGYTMDGIKHEDSLSLFYNTSPDFDWQLPASLRPTSIQRLVPHHPWFDLFPIPRMRDNLILAGDSLDEGNLCLDLTGFTAGRAVRPGIAIWGEAWDPLCCEVTKGFARNWRWLLEGCDELLKSSQKWRVRRGEGPMTL
jgi:hypothetical protein